MWQDSICLLSEFGIQEDGLRAVWPQVGALFQCELDLVGAWPQVTEVVSETGGAKKVYARDSHSSFFVDLY